MFSSFFASAVDKATFEQAVSKDSFLDNKYFNTDSFVCISILLIDILYLLYINSAYIMPGEITS
jgi:hypothetical protein